MFDFDRSGYLVYIDFVTLTLLQMRVSTCLSFKYRVLFNFVTNVVPSYKQLKRVFGFLTNVLAYTDILVKCIASGTFLLGFGIML